MDPKVKARGNGNGGEVKEDKIRKETVLGRVVLHYPDGSPSAWEDTGEVFDRAAAEEQAMIDAGADAMGVKQETINAPVLFWVKEYVEGEQEKRNPIRGFLLNFFEPPESFAARSDDEDKDDDVPEEVSRGARRRLAAWVKLSVPCMVKDMNKQFSLAPIGSIVWMDVNHANNALVTAARPIFGEDGSCQGVVEVQVEPLRKVPFPSRYKPGETWSAWRMRVSGGWRQARQDALAPRRGGFRSLGVTEIQKLGHRLAAPTILDMEAALKLALGPQPTRPALMAGDGHGAPALPESAGASS